MIFKLIYNIKLHNIYKMNSEIQNVNYYEANQEAHQEDYEEDQYEREYYEEEYNSFDDYGDPNEEEYSEEIHYWMKGEDEYRYEIIGEGSSTTYIWYKNEELHNENGPALLENLYDGWQINKYWYKDGKLENLNGYAIEFRDYMDDDFSNEYYIDDLRYTRAEYDIKIKEMREELKNNIYESFSVCKDIAGVISQYII